MNSYNNLVTLDYTVNLDDEYVKIEIKNFNKKIKNVGKIAQYLKL